MFKLLNSKSGMNFLQMPVGTPSLFNRSCFPYEMFMEFGQLSSMSQKDGILKQCTTAPLPVQLLAMTCLLQGLTGLVRLAVCTPLTTSTNSIFHRQLHSLLETPRSLYRHWKFTTKVCIAHAVFNDSGVTRMMTSFPNLQLQSRLCLCRVFKAICFVSAKRWSVLTCKPLEDMTSSFP